MIKTAVDEAREAFIKIGEYKQLLKEVREMREAQLKKNKPSVLENKVDIMKSEIFNEDCMEGMKRYPNKYFDLAIVDPPYGLGMDKGKIGGSNRAKAKDYGKNNWDSIASREFFIELQRVSRNQIVWGSNHFIDLIPLNNSPCWIVWDKLRDPGSDYADVELAWTSFNKVAKLFRWMWNGYNQSQNSLNPFLREGNHKKKEQRIHPTQKPVQLYKWLLTNYANKGDKILDTHLGSGSSRIAAFETKYEFTGFETDKEYFEASEKRFQDHISQLKLF